MVVVVVARKMGAYPLRRTDQKGFLFFVTMNRVKQNSRAEENDLLCTFKRDRRRKKEEHESKMKVTLMGIILARGTR